MSGAPAQFTAELRGMLPAPVDVDSVGSQLRLTGGDPGLVSVTLRQEEVVVAAVRIEWVGPHEAERRDREVGRAWLGDSNPSLVREARRRRLRTFRTCSLCGERNPPEWMHDANVCQNCAESRLGVVY